MYSPSPPPLRRYHTTTDLPYEIYSQGSEASFDHFSNVDGSDRYSDVPLYRSQTLRPKIETRQPSHTEPTMFGGLPPLVVNDNTPLPASASSTTEYLYFTYTRTGSKWDEDPVIDKMPASQSDIKKKAESKNKGGTALEHLQRMGYLRRGQIDRHQQALNASELDGSVWEPIYINDTKIYQKGLKAAVRAFEIIFAKRQPINKRNSVPVVPTLPSLPQMPPFEFFQPDVKEAKAKKEKRKSKEKKAEKAPAKGGLTDDPFGETPLIDQMGATLGGPANASSGFHALPPFIPREKPIAPVQPKIIQGLNPDHDFAPGNAQAAAKRQSVNLEGNNAEIEEILRNPDEDDSHGDIITVRDGRRRYKRESRDRGRRVSTRSRSRSRSRPRLHHLRQQSNSQTRNVRFSNGSGFGFHFPTSSSSSVTSGDTRYIWDEVEELSSRTSEETSGTPAQKIYRAIVPASRVHRPGPLTPPSPRHYETTGDEKVHVMPAKSRRRSSRLVEQDEVQKHHGLGLEQPLVRRHTSPRHKATIHQLSQPSTPIASADVPPIAVFPSHFEKRDRDRRREYEDTERADNYMRDTVRERNLREREEALARQEQANARRDEERRAKEMLALRDQLESARLDREFGARRTVYDHNPRELYGSRRQP